MHGTYLCANGSTDIDKLHMREFPLNTLDLWVCDSPANESLEGSDGVAEVGGL